MERGDLLRGVALAGRVKPVLLFHLPAMGDCPLEVETVRDFLSVPVHPHGHDVHVLPVNIGMLENNVGLFPVPHALHKILGQNNHLVRGQLVLGRGIQRKVNDGLPHVGIEV